MTVRFRIRTSQGQELSFASHEMFEEFVRSGDLAPDDLVYDGETSEWAPARTHPLVLEIEYEREDEAAASEGSAEEAGGPAGAAAAAGAGEEDVFGLEQAAAEAGDAFGLELAPPVEGLSPEEEGRAFVQRLESERALEAEFSGTSTSGFQGFQMDDSSTLAEMAQARPTPEPTPPPPVVRPKPQRPARIKVARPRKKKTGRKIAIAVLLLVLLGVGGYVGLGFFAPPAQDSASDSPLVPDAPPPQPDPPAPDPVIPSTESAVRERAQERFLAATQALVGDLEPIPDAWLSGPYFQIPSDFPEIRAIWQEYRSTVRTVRQGGEERYRMAYGAALDDAGVTDPAARATRLAAATAAFAPRLAEADAHWGRAEALALAAVQSHDALLGAEGLLLYDPSGTTGRPAGIAAGASGRDSDAQLLLEQVVDLMRRTLEADGLGPREGANVREWVWGGFLDVVTR